MRGTSSITRERRASHACSSVGWSGSPNGFQDIVSLGSRGGDRDTRAHSRNTSWEAIKIGQKLGGTELRHDWKRLGEK